MAERYQTPKQLENHARSYTNVAIRTLAHLCQYSKHDSVRRAAANDLLDRGWGRPTQHLNLNDTTDNGMLEIVRGSYTAALEQLKTPPMIEQVMDNEGEETEEDILGIRRRPKLLDRGED